MCLTGVAPLDFKSEFAQHRESPRIGTATDAAAAPVPTLLSDTLSRRSALSGWPPPATPERKGAPIRSLGKIPREQQCLKPIRLSKVCFKGLLGCSQPTLARREIFHFQTRLWRNGRRFMLKGNAAFSAPTVARDQSILISVKDKILPCRCYHYD